MRLRLRPFLWSTGPVTENVAESYDRQSRLPLGIVWTDEWDQLIVCRQVAACSKNMHEREKVGVRAQSLFGG